MKSRKFWVIALILVFIGVVGLLLLKNREVVYEGEVDIVMNEQGFDKPEIKVKKGTKVNFVNKDTGARWPASDLHPSHGIFPEFDPERPIKSGETWSFTFEKTGEWGMHDHISPYFVGVITVVN